MPEVPPVVTGLAYNAGTREATIDWSGPLDPATTANTAGWSWSNGTTTFPASGITNPTPTRTVMVHNVSGSITFQEEGLWYARPPGVLQGSSGLYVASFHRPYP